jgi:hypothetical protein
MNKSFSATVAVVGSALVGLVCIARAASVPAAAQQRGGAQATAPPAPAKPVPRTPWDGKPDLTGVWGGPLPAAGTPTSAERGAALAELARTYQPWALERSNGLAYLEDPRLHCGPYGFPRYIGLVSLAAPRNAFYFLLQIVQAPKETDVLIEYIYSGYRAIPTDGSTHPKTIVPSYFGDSVGRWEGDTLVVDVKGFNGKVWLDSGKLGTRPQGDLGGGTMTSDALHVVERWGLADGDTLEYQATVEDPKVLTRSWTTPKYLIKRAAPDAIIHEALCLEPEDLGVIQAAAKEKEQKK